MEAGPCGCRGTSQADEKVKKSDRPVQYFTDEYLELCKELRPEQIVRFLDDYRKMNSLRQVPGANQEFYAPLVRESRLRRAES